MSNFQGSLMFFSAYIVIIVFCFALLILSLALLLESIAASQHLDNQFQNFPKWQKIKVTIVIPAYNEEKVIKKTLKSIIPQLKVNDKLIVIADNCTDNTAKIATDMGAIVKERQDKHNIGKGYVLDYGLQYLKNNPPDVVIFIDADSIVDTEGIAILAEKAISSGKPVQGLYLMTTSLQPKSVDQISAFAFKVKNLVRPLGLTNLKQSCLLTGTGMAFPWNVIKKINLANDHIVEDMKLGLDLAIAGYPPQFCPQALIKGNLSSRLNISKTQRKRWEHGHLKTLLSYLPLLFKESIKQKKLSLLMVAIDLAIPPLSLFVLMWLTMLIISLLTYVLADIKEPLLISVISGFIIITSISIAWIKFGREDLPLKTFIKVPFYLLWKLPLYFQFILHREIRWIRTERDH